jgi:hypothetical protein
VKVKLNAVRDVVNGKRVVVVDDSIVRDDGAQDHQDDPGGGGGRSTCASVPSDLLPVLLRDRHPCGAT